MQSERLSPMPNTPHTEAPALSASVVRLLAAIIAGAGIAGIVVVLGVTSAGTAPGNSEQVFDAPGCGPEHYDGPGRSARFPAYRDCPTPTPAIVLYSHHTRDGWHVIWDGSRSFDPDGEKLVKYVWSISTSPKRQAKYQGVDISLTYRKPGRYRVVLYVTDESGSTGTATYSVRLR
jgi:hypothetical protein